MVQSQAGSRFVGGADYAALNERSVRDFLAPLSVAKTILGGEPSAWTVREVGDGNLNLVFIVKGTKGGLVVKQALPYVRMVGESWPLPLDRAYFEHEALKIQTLAAPNLVPKIFHFDTMQAAIVMELLEPHLILRKGLIKGAIRSSLTIWRRFVRRLCLALPISARPLQRNGSGRRALAIILRYRKSPRIWCSPIPIASPI